ncbi:MAG: hypothetical protein LAT68_16700 [Cyclobacteriaceae bacterium]|nr:hypothetical protein [Cyclobacteriaceae bacterium]MCH8517942.1 hypothetical protein [Cyclobacteriaceae bacterium]
MNSLRNIFLKNFLRRSTAVLLILIFSSFTFFPELYQFQNQELKVEVVNSSSTSAQILIKQDNFQGWEFPVRVIVKEIYSADKMEFIIDQEYASMQDFRLTITKKEGAKYFVFVTETKENGRYGNSEQIKF